MQRERRGCAQELTDPQPGLIFHFPVETQWSHYVPHHSNKTALSSNSRVTLAATAETAPVAREGHFQRCSAVCSWKNQKWSCPGCGRIKPRQNLPLLWLNESQQLLFIQGEPKSPNFDLAQEQPQNHPASAQSDPVSRISSCVKVAELKWKKPHNWAIYCTSQ